MTNTEACLLASAIAFAATWFWAEISFWKLQNAYKALNESYKNFTKQAMDRADTCAKRGNTLSAIREMIDDAMEDEE